MCLCGCLYVLYASVCTRSIWLIMYVCVSYELCVCPAFVSGICGCVCLTSVVCYESLSVCLVCDCCELQQKFQSLRMLEILPECCLTTEGGNGLDYVLRDQEHFISNCKQKGGTAIEILSFFLPSLCLRSIYPITEVLDQRKMVGYFF